MFKFFAIVIFAILAFAAAAPKAEPGVIAASYAAPLVAPRIHAPLAYSARVLGAAPYAYPGQIHPVGLAYY